MTKLQNWSKLYASYKNHMIYAKNNGVFIFEEWKSWPSFWNWALANGYDHAFTIMCSHSTPFTPEYTTIVPFKTRDHEYIAYHSTDPYQLPIASASSVVKLSEMLKENGYDYEPKTIRTLMTRKRPPNYRPRKGFLSFEKIDLTDYKEDDEPFEERNDK